MTNRADDFPAHEVEERGVLCEVIPEGSVYARLPSRDEFERLRAVLHRPRFAYELQKCSCHLPDGFLRLHGVRLVQDFSKGKTALWGNNTTSKQKSNPIVLGEGLEPSWVSPHDFAAPDFALATRLLLMPRVGLEPTPLSGHDFES